MTTAPKKTVNTKAGMIPWYFVMFFGVIIIVNTIFIYNALKTHSGVVTEQAYEKGLAFNQTIAKAKSQPQWRDKASYENGALTWEIRDENGAPIKNAKVRASFFRPIKTGHDFSVDLTHKGSGIYQAKPNIPISGRWVAKLDCQWNTHQYKTALELIAP